MSISIVPEKTFEKIFRTENFGAFFYNQIGEFNWKFLLYADANYYYVPDLVVEFYKSFTRDGISNSGDSIYMMWRGSFFDLNLNIISAITGIEIRPGNQQPAPTEFYLPLMGTNCQLASDSGIRSSMTFRNVFTTARWLHKNVFGRSSSTSLYLPELHIIHCLMINDRNFCMCRQLLKTISDMYTRPRITYPLPVLVTMICQFLMGPQAFTEHINTHQVTFISSERISSAYRKCLHTYWYPGYIRNIPSDDSSDSEEDELPPLSFYEEPYPTETRELIDKVFKGMRGIVMRQINTDKKIDRLLDDKFGSSSTGRKRRH